jgi:hypothetical protein
LLSKRYAAQAVRESGAARFLASVTDANQQQVKCDTHTDSHHHVVDDGQNSTREKRRDRE